MKKISIITISFNQSQFIREAIESVLSQGYANLEYIVVDPGSNDGSREIIDEYGDKIVKVYEPDQGQADGLNHGLKKATGEIIGFVNSDDLLLPGALSFVASEFERSNDLGVLFGSGFRVNKELRPIKTIIPDRFTTNRYAFMAFNFIQTATFFRLEDVRALNGFNINNRTCWDGELIAMMGKRGVRMKLSFQKLAMFRIYDESISGSQSNGVEYMSDRFRIAEQLLDRPLPKFWKLRQNWYRLLNILETPQKLF